MIELFTTNWWIKAKEGEDSEINLKKQREVEKVLSQERWKESWEFEKGEYVGAFSLYRLEK